jgi:hypothetical protein
MATSKGKGGKRWEKIRTLESSRNVLEVGHSTGTGGLTPLGLLSPVVGSELGSGVTTLGARPKHSTTIGIRSTRSVEEERKEGTEREEGGNELVLPVEGPGPASSADGVGLGVSLTAALPNTNT